jgi:hypothetical protein
MQNFLSLVIPHFITIFTISANEYINTGKRVLDNAFIAIITACFSYFITKIPTLFLLMLDFICIRLFENSVFKPENVNPALYTPDAIAKYSYSFQIYMYNDSDCGELKTKINKYEMADWIFITYGKMIGNDNSEMIYNMYDKKLELIFDIRNGLPNMPVWRYASNNKYEYIMLYKNYLYCNDLKELDNFVKLFIKENVVKISNKFIFELDYNGRLVKKGTVNKNKVFDKLHFDKKEDIITLLDKFKSKTLYPDSLSLDNKLGFLFHGPCGTAKSGTCSAIANYLDRDILLLNSLMTLSARDVILTSIESCRKTHVIVLDEFDHILCEEHGEKPNFSQMLLDAKTEEEKMQIKKDMKSYKEKGISDEVFLLKLLDSFGDDDDRIIVATTNNPHLINKRYLRPGRFDVIELFGYCSMNMFRDITKSYYPKIDDYIDQNRVNIESALSLNITPLVLINFLVKTNSLHECVLILLQQPQETYLEFDRKN